MLIMELFLFLGMNCIIQLWGLYSEQLLHISAASFYALCFKCSPLCLGALTPNKNTLKSRQPCEITLDLNFCVDSKSRASIISVKSH